MMNKCNIVLLVVSLLFSSSLIAGTIDVTKRGAKGDGVTAVSYTHLTLPTIA